MGRVTLSTLITSWREDSPKCRDAVIAHLRDEYAYWSDEAMRKTQGLRLNHPDTDPNIYATAYLNAFMILKELVHGEAEQTKSEEAPA
jgi:hypothetical protein